MRYFYLRRSLVIIVIFIFVFPFTLLSQQQPNDLEVALKVVSSNASPRVRAEQADTLCKACVAHIRAGDKAAVIALLDRLIVLLDDKNSAVVYWVAMSIGTLRKDGMPALPKLEELNTVKQLEIGKSSLTGVRCAIKQIRDK